MMGRLIFFLCLFLGSMASGNEDCEARLLAVLEATYASHPNGVPEALPNSEFEQFVINNYPRSMVVSPSGDFLIFADAADRGTPIWHGPEGESYLEHTSKQSPYYWWYRGPKGPNYHNQVAQFSPSETGLAILKSDHAGTRIVVINTDENKFSDPKRPNGAIPVNFRFIDDDRLAVITADNRAQIMEFEDGSTQYSFAGALGEKPVSGNPRHNAIDVGETTIAFTLDSSPKSKRDRAIYAQSLGD